MHGAVVLTPRLHGGSVRALYTGIAIACLLVVGERRVFADELTLNGTWKQSSLREDYTNVAWQDSCGPVPRSQASGGGEVIQVRREGDELSFIGGGRVFRTNQCYETLPNLVRDAHSRDASGRSFRTHCATPANDPRHADLQTVISATDNRIDLVETGRYTSTVAEGQCAATVRRTRSFTLIAREGAGEPAAAATTESAATSASATAVAAVKPPRGPTRANCTEVGAPARLDVRPSKKVLTPGESFAFSAQLFDGSGCLIRSEPRWSTPLRPGVSVSATGTVNIAADAREGAYELTVTAGERSARVHVEVATPENYDALLKQQGLDANGELDDLAAVTVSGVASDHGESTAEDGSKRRRVWFLALLAVALAALAGIVLWLQRRHAHARAADTRAAEAHSATVAATLAQQHEQQLAYASQMQAHEASVAAKAKADAVYREKLRALERAREELVRKCPTCQREYQTPTAFCPHDGVALLSPAAATGRIPKSGKSDPPQASELLGVALTEGTNGASSAANPPNFAASQAPAPPSKLCPKCGARFDIRATFCGKDGGTLVLVNA
jgi:ribosomal protein L40E